MKNSDINCTEVLMFSTHARLDVRRKFSSVRTANARMHTHRPRKIRPMNKDMYTSPSHFEYLVDGYYF